MRPRTSRDGHPEPDRRPEKDVRSDLHWWNRGGGGGRLFSDSDARVPRPECPRSRCCRLASGGSECWAQGRGPAVCRATRPSPPRALKPSHSQEPRVPPPPALPSPSPCSDIKCICSGSPTALPGTAPDQEVSAWEKGTSRHLELRFPRALGTFASKGSFFHKITITIIIIHSCIRIKTNERHTLRSFPGAAVTGTADQECVPSQPGGRKSTLKASRAPLLRRPLPAPPRGPRLAATTLRPLPLSSQELAGRTPSRVLCDLLLTTASAETVSKQCHALRARADRKLWGHYSTYLKTLSST